jgi:hypothetical protein
MNTRISLLTAALLLTGASSAFAASSTDLTVTGKITPAACLPSLSDNGTVDFGKRSVSDLKQTSTTHLGMKYMQVSVGCDGPTTFALNLIDNRAYSAFAPEVYGLGKTDAGEKLGGFTVAYSRAITESGPSNALVSFDEGKTWKRTESIPIDPGSWASAGNNASGDWAPVLIKTLVMDMEINAFIARADGLTLTDEESIDGAATLEVKYL